MIDEAQVLDEKAAAAMVADVLAGNSNAFENLIRKYKDDIAPIVLKRIPAQHYDDIMQEIFIRAFKNLRSWSGVKPFRNWLAGIAVRSCCDHWRKEYSSKRKLQVSLSEEHLNWAEKVADGESSSDFRRFESSREARDILRNCLGVLKPDDRMLLTLIYFEGYTTEEAAEFMGLSSHNVKIKTFRAREKMRQQLSRLSEGEKKWQKRR